MTVCIAAVCNHLKKDRIILCHDWQGTYNSLGFSDQFDKQRYLGKNWMALVSGDLSQADELCAILYGSLDRGTIDENVALKLVREGVFEYKKRLIDQFLQGSYGIDHDKLCGKGKEIFPEILLDQIHRDVGNVNLGVDILITGFFQSEDYATGDKFLEPCIIRVLGTSSQALDVSLQSPFSCIGDGGHSALASLLYRGHNDRWKLKKTVYAVYEAKRLAEILPTVGTSTSVYVQSEDEPLRYINNEGFSQCGKMFAVFGPKRIRTKRIKEFTLSLDHFTLDVKLPKGSKGNSSPAQTKPALTSEGNTETVKTT
jgi:hypothetical protein